MSVLGELDHTGMLWQSSKADPILSETTDSYSRGLFLRVETIMSLEGTAFGRT